MADFLVFAAILAVLRLLVFRYRFGDETQVETLVGILRWLDPGYLTKDFIVNASAGATPRTYYFVLMGTLSRALTIEGAFYVSAHAAAFLAALATLVMTRRLFPASRIAPFLAASLVAAVDSYRLAGYSWPFENQLVPSVFGTAVALLVIYTGLVGRWRRTLGIVVCTAFLHPLILQVGLLTMGSLWLAEVFSRRRRWQTLLGLTAGAGIMLAVGVVLYGRQLDQTLPIDEFHRIYAQVRIPHHVLPSHFGALNWAAFCAFLVATALLFGRWRRSHPLDNDIAGRLVALYFGLSVVFACGYLFVEVWPVRVVIASHAYRLTFIIIWLGLILAAGAAAQLFREGRLTERIAGACLLYGTSIVQPYMMAGAAAASALRMPKLRTVAAVLIGAAAVIATRRWGDGEELRVALAFSAMGAWFAFVPRPWLRLGIPVVGLAVLISALAVTRHHEVPFLTGVMARFQPVFRYEQNYDSVYAIADVAKQKTPPDALFFVPPGNMARFRILAERAVVVEPKAFPFNDSAMAEWYRRMIDVYGPGKPGTHVVYYNQRSDDEWRALSKQYAADYAVVDGRSKSKLPVVGESSGYRILKVR